VALQPPGATTLTASLAARVGGKTVATGRVEMKSGEGT